MFLELSNGFFLNTDKIEYIMQVPSDGDGKIQVRISGTFCQFHAADAKLIMNYINPVAEDTPIK